MYELIEIGFETPKERSAFIAKSVRKSTVSVWCCEPERSDSDALLVMAM